MMKIKTLFNIFLVLFVLFLTAPVFAQDGAIVMANGTPPIDSIAENLVRLIYDATYLPFAAGMVVVATAFSKQIPLLNRAESSVHSLLWTVVLWSAWVGANQIGYGGQFESVITGLTTIGAAMLGITLTPMAAGKVYDTAKAQKVALLGSPKRRSAPKSTDTETLPNAA